MGYPLSLELFTDESEQAQSIKSQMELLGVWDPKKVTLSDELSIKEGDRRHYKDLSMRQAIFRTAKYNEALTES